MVRFAPPEEKARSDFHRDMMIVARLERKYLFRWEWKNPNVWKIPRKRKR